MAHWLPIESAPKDGMDELLVVDQFDEHYVVFWDTTNGGWLQNVPATDLLEPVDGLTHWMPIPPRSSGAAVTESEPK